MQTQKVKTWINPFARHDRQEFLGVVVPLSQTPRFQNLNINTATSPSPCPSTSISPETQNLDHRRNGDDASSSNVLINKDDVDKDKLDRVSSEENGAAPNPEYSHQTIEAIRAEVEAEISTSGSSTTYDRRSFLPFVLSF